MRFNNQLDPRQLVRRVASKFDLSIVSHRNDDERSILAHCRKIKRERSMLLSDYEAINLFRAVCAVSGVFGDMAEVGSYQGASAKLIHFANPVKALHLFDTFSGLPTSSREEDFDWTPGRFAASVEDVRKYFAKIPQVILHQGIFPQETGHEVADCRFSLVHLDCDLAEAIHNSLEFFYTRMTSGAILICHDFHRQRARNVFAEFFSSHSGTYLAILTQQALFIKCTSGCQ